MRVNSSPGLLFLIFLAGLAVAGCSEKEAGHYYLIAKRIDAMPGVQVTLSIIRRFERENWCQSAKESYQKEDEFTAQCTSDAPVYEAMFEAKAVGHWYLIERMGAFPPSIIRYEFDPPLPEELMIAQLKQLAPHALKFAALHGAPAEVEIISPDGEVIK